MVRIARFTQLSSAILRPWSRVESHAFDETLVSGRAVPGKLLQTKDRRVVHAAVPNQPILAVLRHYAARCLSRTSTACACGRFRRSKGTGDGKQRARTHGIQSKCHHVKCAYLWYLPELSAFAPQVPGVSTRRQNVGALLVHRLHYTCHHRAAHARAIRAAARSGARPKAREKRPFSLSCEAQSAEFQRLGSSLGLCRQATPLCCHSRLVLSRKLAAVI
eukprot:6188643-Pleurochrysis_carterae.AAC.1